MGNLHFMTRNATADATLTNRMTITNTGNVGIGTTNPQGILHVNGGTGDAKVIIESDTNNSGEGDNPKIVFRQDGGYYTGEVGLANNQMVFRSKSTLDGNTGFVFYSNVSSNTSTTNVDDVEETQVEVMRIGGNGNVGIGTASPRAKLEVYGLIMGSTNSTAYSHNLYYDTQWKYAEADYGGATMRMIDSEVQFWNAPNNNASANSAVAITQRFTIAENGNVGIGTASPGYKLEVNGSSMFRSAINLTPTSGYANMELGGPSGAYIDLKNPASDDYDFRILTNGTGGEIQIGGAGTVMTYAGSGNVGIGAVDPRASLDIGGSTFKYGYEYRYQHAWTSNNNQTFTIPVTGTSARGEMIVEAEVIQVAANSSSERLARIKGIITNYNTGNFYIKLFEGTNVEAFETYVVGTSALASGTFTLKYQPQAGYQQSVVCRLNLKIFIGGYTSYLGSLTRTDNGSNSALTAPTFDTAPHSFGGSVGIGTDNPTGEFHINGENMYFSSKLVSNCTWRIMPQTGNSTKQFRIYDQDNTADRLVIDASGNVGIGTTNPGVTLDVNGYISHNNPVFYAHNFGNGGGTTSSGNYIVYKNTEVNVGSNFSTSTGIFTCPRNGVYKFTWGAIGGNVDTVYRYYIRINNANIINGTHNRIDNSASGGNYGNGTSSVILSLSTNDTVRIYYLADNGSTASYGFNYDIFMGYMISA